MARLLSNPRETLALHGATVDQAFSPIGRIRFVGLVVIGDVITDPVSRQRPTPRTLKGVSGGAVVSSVMKYEAIARLQRRECNFVVTRFPIPIGGGGYGRRVGIRIVGVKMDCPIVDIPTVRAAGESQGGLLRNMI